MAFNAYQDYLDQQRRQRRWEIALPIFIVAVLLLILAILFHGAYVRSHAKPKPAAAEVTFYDVQTSGYDPGHAIGNPGTVWIKCNAGMDVTDLRDCPEYQNEGAYLAYAAAQARKHKRKHYRGAYGKLTGDGGWLVKRESIDPGWYTPFNPHGHVTMQELKRMQDGGHDCILAINAECWVTLDPDPAYNPLAHDGDMGSHGLPVADGSECVGFKGFHYSEAAHGCLEDGYPCYKDCGADYYMPHFVQCPAGATCTPVEQTTPQDITNLMEQIAPTDKQEKPRVFGIPQGETVKPKPIVEWHIDPPAKPACRMPADIDVCPQTVDPKGSHD